MSFHQKGLKNKRLLILRKQIKNQMMHKMQKRMIRVRKDQKVHLQSSLQNSQQSKQQNSLPKKHKIKNK